MLYLSTRFSKQCANVQQLYQVTKQKAQLEQENHVLVQHQKSISRFYDEYYHKLSFYDFETLFMRWKRLFIELSKIERETARGLPPVEKVPGRFSEWSVEKISEFLSEEDYAKLIVKDRELNLDLDAMKQAIAGKLYVYNLQSLKDPERTGLHVLEHAGENEATVRTFIDIWLPEVLGLCSRSSRVKYFVKLEYKTSNHDRTMCLDDEQCINGQYDYLIFRKEHGQPATPIGIIETKSGDATKMETGVAQLVVQILDLQNRYRTSHPVFGILTTGYRFRMYRASDRQVFVSEDLVMDRWTELRKILGMIASLVTRE